MKILDEKGRLFGKINLIDLLVLVLIVAVIIFAAIRFTGRGAGEDPGTEVGMRPITYTVLVRAVEPVMYEQVTKYVDAESGVKDQLVAGADLVNNGYVVDCAATPHITYATTADGDVVAVESHGADRRLDLVFTIQTMVAETVINDMSGQQIRVGAYNTVKTTHFEFINGTVLEFEFQ